METICNEIYQECERLASPNFNSILRQSSISALEKLCPESIVTELSKAAPIFLTFLIAAPCPKTSTLDDAKKALSHTEGNLFSAVSSLMLFRNRKMSAFQHLIAMLLRESGCKKVTFTRMQRLGLSVVAESERKKASERKLGNLLAASVIKSKNGKMKLKENTNVMKGRAESQVTKNLYIRL